MTGKVLAGYELLERVGEGSYGSVWRARDPQLGKTVAIKLLPEALTRRNTDRERFARGARAAARLEHPGIAAIFVAEFSGEIPYLVSEFVSGETISARTSRGPLPAREAIDLAIQAARALQYAHSQGVIHRDISGGNVMVTKSGHLKIVDFGLAIERDQTQMTTQGAVLGTAPYMAPEALRGAPPAESRDTYALGVILYQLLTGRLPFKADSFETLVYRILHEEAAPPSVHDPRFPAALDRIALRVLEKDPRRRATLRQLIADLEVLRGSDALRVVDQTETGSLGPGSVRVSPLWKLGRRLTTLSPSRSRKLVLMAIAVLASIGVLAWLSPMVLPLGPAKPRVASLAVLPFFNESADGSFEYIGHGLAEHLVSRLEGLKGLLVQPYRRTLEGDAAELAEKLNVEGVLEGSFSVHEGTVNLHVDLVKRDGTRKSIAQVKAPGFKAAAEELASEVAGGLKSRLTSTEAAHVTAPAAASNEAFDALSTAIDAHQRGERELALQWYQRAAQLDPGLAKAYVGIGAIHYHRYFICVAGQQSLDVAETNFKQALAIDPDDGGALRGLIGVESERGNREGALAVTERMKTGDGTALDKLLVPAWAYTLNGWPDLSAPLLRRATELDPLNIEAHWFLVIASAWCSLDSVTIQTGSQYLARFPEDPEVHLWVAVAHERLGHVGEAKTHFTRALELFQGDTQLYVSSLASDFFRRRGNAGEFHRVLEDALGVAELRRAIAPDNFRLRNILAGLYARLGRRDEFLSEVDAITAQTGTGFVGEYNVGIWLGEAYLDPRTKPVATRFLKQDLGLGSPFWVDPQYDLDDACHELLHSAEVRPQLRAARAYDDSLRQAHGFPPKWSRATSPTATGSQG